MALEIERKFLVKNDEWKKSSDTGTKLIQGYIASENATIRIRVAGEKSFLTIKGRSTANGVSRNEFEYAIPLQDAEKMLDELCEKPYIEKTRYIVVAEDSHKWELDVFEGANHGLVIAEIELENEDEGFALPDWAGEEVSSRPKYRNSSLAKRPFSTWN